MRYARYKGYEMLPYGVMFHHFHNEKHLPAQGSMTAEELADIIIDLKNRFNLISAKDWYEKAIASKLETRDICLTFDDNLRCQFDIAFPVLKDFGIKAFWFVSTSPLDQKIEKLELYRHYRTTQFDHINDFYNAFNDAIKSSRYQKDVDLALRDFAPNSYLKEYPFYSNEDRVFRYVRDIVLGNMKYEQLMDSMISSAKINMNGIMSLLWMDETCLRELRKDEHIIGLHTHSHPTNLKLLSRNEQEIEFKTNFLKLKEVLGEDVFSMSHPNNSYNDTTLEILRKMNISLGFRSNTAQKQYSQLEHPRLDCVLLKRGKE